MIIGQVSGTLEPTIQLGIKDAAGQSFTIDALIDTGFNGFLTLSPGLLGSLGPTPIYQHRAITADGTIQQLDVYAVTVEWDGQLRVVDTEAVDAHALIGMEMFRGYDLRIEVVPGGQVEIQNRSTP
jgi:clan AA aspartic protease